MNENKFNDEILKAKGFVRDRAGVWSKPERVVPAVCSAPAAEPEPNPEHAPAQPLARKAIYSGRCSVVITNFCCGTQHDPDNIYVKDALDTCRYAGLLHSDCPEQIELQVKERRVLTKKEEGFEIVITPL